MKKGSIYVGVKLNFKSLGSSKTRDLEKASSKVDHNYSYFNLWRRNIN